MIGFYRHYSGVVLGVLAVMLLAACTGAPAPAANAPDSLVGAWTTSSGDTVMYLMLMPDGEFRVADDMTLLFDSPQLLGQFTYDAGHVVLHNAGYRTGACQEPGRYVVSTYADEGSPTFTLVPDGDECADRLTAFNERQWEEAEPAG